MLVGKLPFNLISLVVPTYRQSRTIVHDIKLLEELSKTLGIKYEIIIVVDGMVDSTYEKVKKISSKTIKVLAYKENQGKGHAVRTGMLAAKGDIIGFIDAGMDIDPNGLAMLLNHMVWYNADIIVGSKLHPVSQVNYPYWRKVLSWGYRKLIRLLFGLNVRDSQVGLKLFKRKVVMDVFPRLLVKKFAFDIEILAVANSLGYKRIFDGPIKLDFKQNTINPKIIMPVVFWMLWDTAAVFYRLKILNYYNKKSPASNS